jgi:hypothetical protein
LPPIIIPLLDPLLDPELPLDPLLDPELPELLAVPPLEPELLDVAPELLPFRGPVPLLLVPPLLPLPLLPPSGLPLFMTGVLAPLELPLVSAGGVIVKSVVGLDDVQLEIESATSAAVPRLMEWLFFISASRRIGLLDEGLTAFSGYAPAKRKNKSEI